MNGRATRRTHRREVVLSSLLGIALFLVPLAIDLVRST